jgi:mycofactocin system transcriptional regulator
VGRPPRTTREEIERAALALFVAGGFTETTVQDIAAVAGISRRTFFRYYESKNDVVWGDFDGLLRRMEAALATTADDVPLVEALSAAVLRFNTIPAEAVPAHRARMSLILHVPALQAHSTLRYADWRDVVARFAAVRLGESVDALAPQLVGHLALGAALAAYEQWLRTESEDLGTLLQASFALWRSPHVGITSLRVPENVGSNARPDRSRRHPSQTPTP